MDQKPNRSIHAPLTYFLTGLLGTASTLIALQKYKLALICVLVGGACAVIVSVAIKIANWLDPNE
jgi:hypothetical protein